jgi:hypothetical protein
MHCNLVLGLSFLISNPCSYVVLVLKRNPILKTKNLISRSRLTVVSGAERISRNLKKSDFFKK